MTEEVKCFECGSVDNIHNHHVVPKVRGGTKTIPLCGSCHGLVHGKRLGMEWKRLQSDGIRKAKLEGKYKGRTSIDTIQKFLNKPKNQKIIELLEIGKMYVEIQNEIGCSPNLIRKVKKLSDVPSELWHLKTSEYD